MFIPASLACKSFLSDNLVLSIQVLVYLFDKVSVGSSVINQALVNIVTVFQVLIIEPILLEKNNYEILGDQSNAISTTIKDWEPVMIPIVQSLLNVFESVNAFEGDQISSHQILSNNLLAWSWNLVDQDRHLFASARSLVKRSCKESSNLVGNNNGKDDWNEKGERLRCLHENNCQRVSHPSVSCKNSTTSKYNEMLPCIDIDLLFFSHSTIFCVIFQCLRQNFSQCTSNNHTWQEKSCWYICTISNCHLNVPCEHENE
jgi:hypothetical protein